jgi:hypothetical protein
VIARDHELSVGLGDGRVGVAVPMCPERRPDEAGVAESGVERAVRVVPGHDEGVTGGVVRRQRGSCADRPVDHACDPSLKRLREARDRGVLVLGAGAKLVRGREQATVLELDPRVVQVVLALAGLEPAAERFVADRARPESHDRQQHSTALEPRSHDGVQHVVAECQRPCRCVGAVESSTSVSIPRRPWAASTATVR